MAAGDELVDHFDQAYLKNRLSDGAVEVMFAGTSHGWKPGETRSITRAYLPHFLKGSTILEDPTRQNPPVELLVEVDLTGAAVTPGATVEPMLAAEADEIKRYGIVDESNLPSDRYLDDQTGLPQTRRELLRVNRGFDPIRRKLPSMPADTAGVLDHVAESLVAR